MENAIQAVDLALRRSALWRLVALVLLVLMLLIPVAWIRELINERQVRKDEAVKEVSAKWGQKQVITGPALVIPCSVGSDRPGRARDDVAWLTVLPQQLRMKARVESE